MDTTKAFETHTAKYEAWFEKYNMVYESEILALRRQFRELPENIHGIEVGMGLGKYAIPLGIKEGVEPAESLRLMAKEEGLEVMDAFAEHLPYKDLAFDFVLMVTICHLEDAKQAIEEAYRVLKQDGSLILAFIDKESQIGKKYHEKRHKSIFYEHARFYKVDEVKDMLKDAGFEELVFSQTLFRDIDEIDEVEEPREGYGEGSFVIVRCKKAL